LDRAIKWSLPLVKNAKIAPSAGGGKPTGLTSRFWRLAITRLIRQTRRRALRSGRIDQSNQGDVRNVLRSDTPKQFRAPGHMQGSWRPGPSFTYQDSCCRQRSPIRVPFTWATRTLPIPLSTLSSGRRVSLKFSMWMTATVKGVVVAFHPAHPSRPPRSWSCGHPILVLGGRLGRPIPNVLLVDCLGRAARNLMRVEKWCHIFLGKQM
jgi:hypothetical protein